MNAGTGPRQVWEMVAPDLRTDGEGRATYRGLLFSTSQVRILAFQNHWPRQQQGYSADGLERT